MLLAYIARPTAHSPQLKAHNSKPTAHSPQLKAHSSKPPAHSPQLRAHRPHPTAQSPPPTANSPQLNAHRSKPTPHSSQPTALISKPTAQSSHPHIVRVTCVRAARNPAGLFCILWYMKYRITIRNYMRVISTFVLLLSIALLTHTATARSEERRVGKEGRTRWGTEQ